MVVDPVRLVAAYARTLWGGGLALLIATLVADQRWVHEPLIGGLLTVAVVALRGSPVRLSKYSYLTQTPVVGLVGALIAAPSTTALALMLGVAISDLALLRKPLIAAGVNGGREVIAFLASYGFYALALGASGVRTLSLDYLPAAAAFTGSYFFLSRILFYFSLLVRSKLALEERLFILRWEIISFVISMLGASVIIWTLVNLAPGGWPAVGIALIAIGVLTRTLIEESIGAEDLNKVHLMQAEIMTSPSLQGNLAEIERLAYRLLDWGDLRVYRDAPDGPVLVHRASIGRRERGKPAGALEQVRRDVILTGVPAVIHDAERDPRVVLRDPDVRSVVIHPLRLTEETIGTFEVEHHKRHFYRHRDLAAIGGLAGQLSTAIHIAELRRPLARTVAQIEGQVQALSRASDSLRNSAMALASASEAMRRKVVAQDSFAQAGLETTAALAQISLETVEGGRQAAEASRGAASAAARHRLAIGDAIDRLMQVQTFVADTSAQVTGLGVATRRITEFIGNIREIAEATNLIALNASIEAARAGAEGKGFAIVAEEIRSLSVQTTQIANDAGRLIADVTTEVRGIVAQMQLGQSVVEGIGELSGEAAKALDAIVSATHEAGQQARAIAASAEAQQDASLRLADQIRQIADASQDTRAETEALSAQAATARRAQAELENALGDLEQFATHLQAIARHFAAGM